MSKSGDSARSPEFQNLTGGSDLAGNPQPVAGNAQALGQHGSEFPAVVDDRGDCWLAQPAFEAGIELESLQAARNARGSGRVTIMLMGGIPAGQPG